MQIKKLLRKKAEKNNDSSINDLIAKKQSVIHSGTWQRYGRKGLLLIFSSFVAFIPWERETELKRVFEGSEETTPNGYKAYINKNCYVIFKNNRPVALQHMVENVRYDFGSGEVE